MSTSLFNQYAGLAAGWHNEADAGQRAVSAKLEDLRLELANAATPRRAGPFLWLPGSAAKARPLRGLYLWSGAGRGKTIAGGASLLCFDEFSVNDIADAMILGRLFEALFAPGVVIVATSNIRPELLYQDGLNRAPFLPFIALIEERMDIARLDARADFRLEKLGD